MAYYYKWVINWMIREGGTPISRNHHIVRERESSGVLCLDDLISDEKLT